VGSPGCDYWLNHAKGPGRAKAEWLALDPTAPFGGYKESGYGREGGRQGLEAYLDV